MKNNKKLRSVALASTALVLFLILILPTALAMSNKHISSEKTQENSKNSKVNLDKNTVVKITQLKQINAFLQKGPVFVRIGAEWCPACQSLKPTLKKLAAEYRGKATIASVDKDQSPELTKSFGVNSIPDSFVIVGIEKGKYVYMKENGEVSMDRSQARIIGLQARTIGLNDNNKKVFEKILDLALIQQDKAKSKRK